MRDLNSNRPEGDEALEARLAALKGTLDAWEDPADPDDPCEVAARALREAPRPRVARAAWVPVVAGLTAATLLFTLLVAMGARVEREGDRLALSLRLPWSAGDAPQVALPQPRLATEEQLFRIGQGLAKQQAALEEQLREQQLDLARAVDSALIEERRRVATWLGTVTNQAARADERTRKAVAQLASRVSTEPR